MKWIPLFITNFLGVFNDNLLKNLISFIGITWLAKSEGPLVVTGATACLVLPYVLFSPWAGKLSKQESKVLILRWLKLAELPIMGIAVFGFMFESVALVLLAMLCMGLQSCLYSPAKYGLIREIGGVKGISFGTGSMEMLTFIGVLLGAFAGGYISDLEGMVWGISKVNLSLAIILLLTAFLGWLSSKKIIVNEEEPDKESENTLNPISFLYRTFNEAKEFVGLNFVVLGLSFFWLVGSLLQMNVIIHCPEVYNLSNTETSLIMAAIAIGIGTGCGLAGVLSKGKVATHFIIIGGIAMGLSTLAIYLFTPPVEIFTLLICLTAFAGGFFKVPLNSWIQANVHGPKLSQMIAYNNLVTFLFILVSAGLFSLIVTNFGTHTIFLAVAIFMVIILTILYKKLAPETKIGEPQS